MLPFFILIIKLRQHKINGLIKLFRASAPQTIFQKTIAN